MKQTKPDSTSRLYHARQIEIQRYGGTEDTEDTEDTEEEEEEEEGEEETFAYSF